MSQQLPVSFWINAFIILLSVGVLAWRGYQSGIIRLVQRLFALIAAYDACYLYSAPASKWLGGILNLQGVSAFIVAGLVLFFGVLTVVNLMLSFVVKALEEHGHEPAKAPAMLIGAGLGLAFGILVVWVVGFFTDALQLKQAPAVSLSTAHQDPVRRVSGQLVGGAVGYILEKSNPEDPLTAQLATGFISNPVQISRDFMEVTSSDAFREFFASPSAVNMMQHGQIDRLLYNPEFRKLMDSPQAVQFFSMLSDAVSSNSNMTTDEKTARLLTGLYRKITQVSHDPRFMALQQREDFQQLLNHPDPVSALRNPALQEFAAIVFSGSGGIADWVSDGDIAVYDAHEEYQTVSPEAVQTPSPRKTEPKPPQTVYRWTDENGKKHFSEQPPPEGYSWEELQMPR